MDYSLEDILLRNNTFHVFDELEGFLNFVILEIVDNQVKSSFRDNINKGRKSLQSVLAASEYNEIVSQQIVVLEYVTSGG